MNILIIKNNNRISAEVYRYIETTGNHIEYIESPTVINESYLSLLMQSVRNNSIDTIFSLGFYPQISLAAGALEVIYTAWITEGYDDNNYNSALRYPWNRIYISDRCLLNELLSYGVNATWLPLSYSAGFISSDTGIISKAEHDITKIAFISSFDPDMTDTEKMLTDLKDSTRGYLDGIIEARKSNLDLQAIYNCLPGYVYEDIETQFTKHPEELRSKGRLFEDLCLFPAIYHNLAQSYIFYILNSSLSKEVEISYITRAYPDSFSDKVNVIDYDSFLQSKEITAFDFDIIVCFPSMNEQHMLGWDTMNIMVAKAFTILPDFTDLTLFMDEPPITFSGKRDLLKKIRFFKSNPEKRQEIAVKICTQVIQSGDYGSRVSLILNDLKGELLHE